MRGPTKRLLAMAPMIAGAVLMAGCAGDFWRPPGTNLEVGDELVVANAVTGERCRVRKLRDLEVRFGLEDFTIVCDGWEEPSGGLRRFRIREGESLEPFLSRPELALWPSDTTACSPVQTLAEDGRTILARSCTAGDGWPLLLIAGRDASASDYAVVAYGLPHVAPVVEAVLAGAEGTTLRAGVRSPLRILAEAQAEAGGEPVGLDQIMDERTAVALGQAYNHAGQFDEAAAAYDRALALRADLGHMDDPSMVNLLAALGLNLAEVERLAEAQLAFDQAQTVAERSGFGADRGRYLGYRAAYARSDGDLERALTLAEAAVTAREGGGDTLQLAHSLAIQVGVLGELGRLDEAAAAIERAIAIAERLRDFVSLSFFYARAAVIERERGQLDLASRRADAAARLTEELFGEGPNLAAIRLEQGRIAAARGNPAAARGYFAEGVAITAARLPETRPVAADAVAPYLDILIGPGGEGTAAASDEILWAVQIVQAPAYGRAVVQMTARLAATDPEIRDLASELDTAREAARDARIGLGRIRLEDARAPAGRDAEGELRAALDEAEARVAELERGLQARFPRYGALVSPTPVSLDQIRAVLRPGEAALRIVSGSEASYALLVGADGEVTAQRIPLGRAALREKVNELRGSLGFAQGLQPFDLEASHALYETLLGPFDGALDRLDHVVLMPDGPLLSLPFGVLVRRPAAPGTYQEADWLAGDVALSVMPSLQSFVRARTDLTASTASLPFLGVGDPDFARGTSRATVDAALAACQEGGRFDPALLQALPPLPETRDELLQVAGELGAGPDALLLGDAATVPAVEAMDLTRYRVISFATHGLLADDLRCRSEPALALTPPLEPTAEDDGLLDASDVASLRLDADWVVPSACNTAGPGGRLGGEALSGLAAAFTYAGARSILASHWDVASDATVRLMTGTFDAIATAGSKAAALQAAQLRLIADPELAHPAFWAPFVLIGDGGPAAPAS
jgi:CHAT domain-containing protein/tetratricopeptide (TPR) repeat protein